MWTHLLICLLVVTSWLSFNPLPIMTCQMLLLLLQDRCYCWCVEELRDRSHMTHSSYMMRRHTPCSPMTRPTVPIFRTTAISAISWPALQKWWRWRCSCCRSGSRVLKWTVCYQMFRGFALMASFRKWTVRALCCNMVGKISTVVASARINFIKMNLTKKKQTDKLRQHYYRMINNGTLSTICKNVY